MKKQFDTFIFKVCIWDEKGLMYAFDPYVFAGNVL